ncbi:hypothetical protein EVAR_4085_1 [Eumeta japonica]|uniref:Uncharacterized protein n=1 Tax=Eumeta variegata TaxID=151549 RepID=A0A4C1T6Q3_EUMVA|nr:hypothetical protein EVAR_4085_1 [Eumeta japonica]
MIRFNTFHTEREETYRTTKTKSRTTSVSRRRAGVVPYVYGSSVTGDAPPPCGPADPMNAQRTEPLGFALC